MSPSPVIYVDVRGMTYSEAAKAIGKALGCSMEYSAEELRARAMGVALPNLERPDDEALHALLSMFKRAAQELLDEGLVTRRPTLVLDHSDEALLADSRGMPQNPLLSAHDLDDPTLRVINTRSVTLIRSCLRACLHPHHSPCCFIMATSGGYLPQRSASWGRGWGGLQVQLTRLPSFTRDEATALIVHAIHARTTTAKGMCPALAAPPAPPTNREFGNIKARYEATIQFLLDAVGCRPSRLLACFQHGQPMTDQQLWAAGHDVRVPGACVPHCPRSYCAATRVQLPTLRQGRRGCFAHRMSCVTCAVASCLAHCS